MLVHLWYQCSPLSWLPTLAAELWQEVTKRLTLLVYARTNKNKELVPVLNQTAELSRLEFYGISGSVHKLLMTYLEGRFQRIRLQSKHHNLHVHSEWGEILHGVPQLSILGPVLFLIYINNLPVLLNMISTPILFADDTSVIISNVDPFLFQNGLKEVFEQLNRWFNTNLLFLNFSKT
jgi:hypothetical protein